METNNIETNNVETNNMEVNSIQKHKILYLTSFSQDLFGVTGKRLVNSFLKFQKNNDLLVCYENFKFNSYYEPYLNEGKLISYNLSKYKFLNQWLANNKDIIPAYMGGTAIKSSATKKIFKVWNRKASRWFRKIASYHYALNKYGNKYDIIIWIDSDCYFTRTIKNDMINKIMTNNDVFYHLGEFRRRKQTGIESGFIGFKKGKGYQILQKVFQLYQSPSFRNLERWDDGYVFKVVIDKCISSGLINAYDVIDENNRLTIKGKKLDCLNKGIFRDYLVHKKGVHRKLNIFD